MRVAALLTQMDEPLGMAVGNALEVEEAIRAMRGDGPKDLVELSTTIVGEMLFLSHVAPSPEAGAGIARRALEDGTGLEWLGRLVAAQGGDPRCLDAPEIMGRAPVIQEVRGPAEGWVHRVDARAIATAALALGAGRARKEDPIDRRVGVVLRARVGARVSRGEPLAVVHAGDTVTAEVAARNVLEAFSVGAEPCGPSAAFLERLPSLDEALPGGSVLAGQSL